MLDIGFWWSLVAGGGGRPEWCGEAGLRRLDWAWPGAEVGRGSRPTLRD